MTDLEGDARRIREAFEQDLACYRAPIDLPERVRLGGQRRARRRRLRRAGCAAAVACAAVASLVATSPRVGMAPAGSGRVRPGSVVPAKPPPLASSAGPAAAKSPAEDEFQVWFWPAQPVPGQQVQMRALLQHYPSSARTAQPVEDWAVAYTNPVRPPPAPYGFTTYLRLTMVCYPPGGGCGYASTNTPPVPGRGSGSRANQRPAISARAADSILPCWPRPSPRGSGGSRAAPGSTDSRPSS